MKLFFTIVLVVFFSFGAYSQTHEQAKKVALPKIVYKNVKARHKQLKAEVINKIINPLLCETSTPVSDITIDFCPEILGPDAERGCKNEVEGVLTISVTVNWADGSSGYALMERNKEGGFDKDDYLKVMGSMSKRKCMGVSEN